MSVRCSDCGETFPNAFYRCACQREPQSKDDRLAELEAENKALAADRAELYVENKVLREAADKYSDGGHHDVCPVNGNYHAKCTCGLAELEPLLE